MTEQPAEQLVLDGWPTGGGDDSVAVAECEPPAYEAGKDPHGGRLDDAQHHDGNE